MTSQDLGTSFYFYEEEDVEHMEDYKPGGYHPVHLGDIFPSRDSPRYRVLHKLGHGAFSTVWLAKDLKANRCVALKIVIARLTGDRGGSAMLEWLNTRPRDLPGADHVVQLHDSFQIHGPNGTHQVLVMDILQRFDSLRGKGAVWQQSQSICRQLLSGLAYLQQEAVVHCNMHIGSIGYKIPGIEQFTEDQLLEWMCAPEITAVVHRDPSVQSDSLPMYLVSDSSVDLPTHIRKEKTVQSFVQIIGFCHAFRLQDYSPLPEVRCSIRAPELTFYDLSDGQLEKEWGLPSDVWSMACMIFEIIFGPVMGQQMDCPECAEALIQNKDACIYEMMKLVGPLPERWKPYWDQEPFEDSNGNIIIDPDAEWPRRLGWDVGGTNKVKNANSLALVDLLRSMLRWEPEARPAVVNLLTHPWFTM